MPKKILKIVGFFVVGMVGGIFADQILWPYFIERPLFYQYRLEQSPIYMSKTEEITIQENAALKKAIEKVEKSAVGLRSKAKTGATLEGSGLIITADGLILTLAELAPQGAAITLFINGKTAIPQVLKRDAENNLALLKIESASLPTVGFGDSEKINLGERVFLAGIIFEKNIPQETVNEGIIKSFNKELIKTNILEKSILSGSSLFDIEGNLLGLNTVDKEGKIITIPVAKIRQFTGL